ncbi:MAG: hypothetical protein EOM28_09515 [Clostridia bacterium]|nr:hypothetical protein [Clostridia bacterium]
MENNYLLTITKVNGMENKIENLASLLASVTQREAALVFEGEGRNKHAHIQFSSSERLFDIKTMAEECEQPEEYLQKENGPKKFGP